LSYGGYYGAFDPHAPLVEQHAEKSWFLSQNHLSEEFVRADRYYSEYMYPREMGCATGTSL
jgi:hypothetical protein